VVAGIQLWDWCTEPSVAAFLYAHQMPQLLRPGGFSLGRSEKAALVVGTPPLSLLSTRVSIQIVDCIVFEWFSLHPSLPCSLLCNIRSDINPVI